MTRAVVFAYHDVGVRCLRVLMAHGVEIPFVVTHLDNHAEQIWFGNVAAAAIERNIPVYTPDTPNTTQIQSRVTAAQPDFLFSFYYRQMLGKPLLESAARGALNIHGSLLPKYRGRAPVNWAIINGERETGATLHYMVEKPDAGDIVDQQSMPILPDDTALDVFTKVSVAAEIVLDRSLPRLIDGTAQRRPQQLGHGSYFGARTPEDGRIDWSRPAHMVHNLIRGVAPPYPGAFSEIRGRRIRVLRSLVIAEPGNPAQPLLDAEGGNCFVRCGDGGVVRLLEVDLEGKPVDASQLERAIGAFPVPL